MELRDALEGGGVNAGVVEDHPDTPGAHHVAIHALEVHAPALDHPRGGDHPLAVHDRLAPEGILGGDPNEQRAALVHMARRALELNPLDADRDEPTVRAAMRLIARAHRLDGRLGEGSARPAE